MGTVQSVSLKEPGPDRKGARRYAFVEFRDPESVLFAVEMLDELTLFGRPIRVSPRDNTQQVGHPLIHSLTQCIHLTIHRFQYDIYLQRKDGFVPRNVWTPGGKSTAATPSGMRAHDYRAVQPPMQHHQQNYPSQFTPQVHTPVQPLVQRVYITPQRPYINNSGSQQSWRHDSGGQGRSNPADAQYWQGGGLYSPDACFLLPTDSVIGGGVQGGSWRQPAPPSHHHHHQQYYQQQQNWHQGGTPRGNYDSYSGRGGGGGYRGGRHG